MTYWQRRQKEQLKALEKSEKALMQRLTAYYRDEYAKLDKEIASFYSKYGVKKIIEYRMLLEDLSPQDRSLLIKNVEEFKEKYPNLKHIVPVRENIYKLNRLEGLQLSIIMQQAEIGTVNEQAVRRHLENLALKNANSVAELLGFGKNFYFENSDTIKNFVGVKWCDGKDFSQRIWENTDKLARYLTTDLAQGFARGESYEKLTTQIGKRFIDVAKRDIYRLVYTEGTYIMAESSAKPFEEDFENYRLSTVGDGKVCPICTSVAENVFRFADREAGVNFPPIHPMCRCTFEIVVDDWNKWLDDYEKKHTDSGKQLMNRLNSDKLSGTIQSAGKSPYSNTELTYNQNAKYEIILDNYSENVCKGLSKACRSVADKGYADNNEHLFLVNLKTGEVEYIEDGLAGEVGGSGFWNFINENKSNSYAFVHNHNNPTQFSETDLRTLLEDNCIDMFVISRFDGKCFVIESNGKHPETLIFDSLYKEDMEKISKKIRNGEITAGERTYLREKTLVDNAIRDYTKGVKEFG